MEQVKPLTELLTKEEIYQLYCKQIQEIEQLREENQRLETELMMLR